MKIIICDDERKDAEAAREILIGSRVAKADAITIVTPQELSMMLEVQDLFCDVAIMDIEYANQTYDGIALSREINEKLPLCQIIYLTWVLEFAPDVYDTKHCYFVLKENMQKMLPRAMEKANAVWQDQEQHEVLEFRDQGKAVCIRQNDIVYVERRERIIVVHTEKKEYQCYLSLSKILKQLSECFLRCHGGYVINYNYIEVVMRDSVRLTTGEEIPVGRTYRTTFHEQYMRAGEQHI